MKIFVTRHGETNYNKNKKVCGLANGILTEKGLQQALDLAERLNKNQKENQIKHIYVSSLQRAIETAKPIEKALNITATVDSRLREFDFGDKDGCNVDDKEFYEMRRQPFYRFPNGESTLTACHRIYCALDEIINKNEDNILIVCHGTTSRLIKTYFDNLSEVDFYKFKMNNCGLLSFEIKK